MGFGKDVLNWSKRTKERRDEVVSTVFKRLGTLIVRRTPIGDITLWQRAPAEGYRPGSLANNWFAGVGEPAGFARNPANPSAVDSLSQINAAALVAPGKLMHIANPLPYARRVEYGWSTQAPQGMVRISVRDFTKLVKQAVADVT